jgi:hypothetical protein
MIVLFDRRCVLSIVLTDLHSRASLDSLEISENTLHSRSRLQSISH